MKRPAPSLLALSLALAIVVAACSSSGGSNANRRSATTTTVKPRDAAEAIAYDPRLSTFATALNASGVLGQLAGTRQVTVFAPDNDAFARIPHVTLLALLTERRNGQLAKFMRSHIVKGAIPEGALHDERLKTVDGSTLTVRKSADGITVSDGHGHTAAVETPPIYASNAVIYPIKTALWPVVTR
jgi:uncharacterized surface protein with fasciclin (FAS1) repeats